MVGMKFFYQGSTHPNAIAEKLKEDEERAKSFDVPPSDVRKNELEESNQWGYTYPWMGKLRNIIPGDPEHDLNALAESLGLSFEEGAARLTARRKENTPLRQARRVVRNFERRRAKNKDLPEPPEVGEARKFVNHLRR
jgi:hypothetical protein